MGSSSGGGATILGLGSLVTLCSSSSSSRGHKSNAPAGNGMFSPSPLSFQTGAGSHLGVVNQATTISLTGISLDGGCPEGASRSRKNQKMHFLLPFNLELMMAGGADTICCGLVGEKGSCFCMKLSRHCSVQGHKCAKMIKTMDLKDGDYINNVVSS
jgi:hypothetical protein